MKPTDRMPVLLPKKPANFPRGRAWRTVWRLLRQRRGARLAWAVVCGYAAVALWGESVVLWNRVRDTTPLYRIVSIEDAHLAPSGVRLLRKRLSETGWADAARTLFSHPLGCDGLGRDTLARFIQGTRIAFRVGVFTSLIALPLGFFLGCLAGYFGGWVDDVVVWLYTTFASIPTLLFVLAVALLAGRGFFGVCLGIGLSTWVGLCRLVRAETMKHRRLDYVTSARVLGVSDRRILFRHICPNLLHLVIVTFTLRFPAAIGMEVFLAFIGVGLEGTPSWGVMIADGRLSLWDGMGWELGFATAGIFGLVLAFHVLGDALRDALDPRVSGSFIVEAAHQP